MFTCLQLEKSTVHNSIEHNENLPHIKKMSETVNRLQFEIAVCNFSQIVTNSVSTLHSGLLSFQFFCSNENEQKYIFD